MAELGKRHASRAVPACSGQEVQTPVRKSRRQIRRSRSAEGPEEPGEGSEPLGRIREALLEQLPSLVQAGQLLQKGAEQAWQLACRYSCICGRSNSAPCKLARMQTERQQDGTAAATKSRRGSCGTGCCPKEHSLRNCTSCEWQASMLWGCWAAVEPLAVGESGGSLHSTAASP